MLSKGGLDCFGEESKRSAGCERRKKAAAASTAAASGNTSIFAAVVRYKEKRSELFWLIDALRYGSVVSAALLNKGPPPTPADPAMATVLQMAPKGSLHLVSVPNVGRESSTYLAFLANRSLRPLWQRHDLLLLAQANPWHLIYTPRTSCLASWLATLRRDTPCVSCFGVRHDFHEHMEPARGLCLRSRFFCDAVPLSQSVSLGLDTFCAGATLAVSVSLALEVPENALLGVQSELRQDVRMEFYLERSCMCLTARRLGHPDCSLIADEPVMPSQKPYSPSFLRVPCYCYATAFCARASPQCSDHITFTCSFSGGRLFGACQSKPSCEMLGPWARPLVPPRPIEDRSRPDYVRADGYRIKSVNGAFRGCGREGGHRVEELGRLFPLPANVSKTYKPVG